MSVQYHYYDVVESYKVSIAYWCGTPVINKQNCGDNQLLFGSNSLLYVRYEKFCLQVEVEHSVEDRRLLVLLHSILRILT